MLIRGIDMKKGNFTEYWNRIRTRMKNPGWIGLLGAGLFLAALFLTLSQSGFISLFTSGLLFGLGAAGLLMAGYWFYYARQKHWAIPAWLLCIAIVLSSILTMEFSNIIQDGLVQMSGPRQAYTASMGVYTSTDGDESSLEFLNGQTLGVMDGRGGNQTQAVLDALKDQGIEVSTKSYSNLQTLYKAVRGQAVRAAILSPVDVKIAQEFGGTANGTSKLHQVFKTDIDTGISIAGNPDLNVQSDPYTVLLSASTTPLAEPSYRSTLNLLIAVNPTARKVLVTLLPRSLYVSSTCSEELACTPADQKDKLAFTSYHSLEALRQTVSELMSVPVDFAARIDLTSLAKLYDLSDTIGIDTSLQFGSEAQSSQTTPMTSPRVSQYLGTLSDFSASDFDQELNQLRMLVSLDRQTSRFANFSNVRPVIDILDHSIATTFSYRQLCSLLLSGILTPGRADVGYTSISGTYQTLPSYTLTEHAYVLEIDPASLEAVKTMVGQTLNGEDIGTTGISAPALPVEAQQ